MNKIIFRADANYSIGSGHIMRCIALAQAAKSRGLECLFVTADDSPDELLGEYGFESALLNTNYADVDKEHAAFSNIINKYDPDIVFVDTYFAHEEYFVKLKKYSRNAVIASFDDMPKEAFACDVLVNYGINGKLMEEYYIDKYAGRDWNRPVLLLGPTYAPLRAEFGTNKRKALNKDVKNILILSGGSDVVHFSLSLIKHVRENNRYDKYKFNIVVGALSPDIDLINQYADEMENVSVYSNVKHMSKLMIDADVVVSAGGTTLMELCACNIPFIPYICVDNQDEWARGIAEKVGIPGVPDARNNPSFLKEVLGLLDEYIDNYELRMEISNKEESLIDGKGALKIIENCIALSKNN